MAKFPLVIPEILHIALVRHWREAYKRCQLREHADRLNYGFCSRAKPIYGGLLSVPFAKAEISLQSERNLNGRLRFRKVKTMEKIDLNGKNLAALARIHAHLCGDGCLCCYKTAEKDRKNRADIYYFNSNVDLIKSFRADMNLLFGVKMTYLPKEMRLGVKSLRIAKILLNLSGYGTREWRIPALIKKASENVKLEWIRAYSHDEGYLPKDRFWIRIKSMNPEGLKDIKSLLDALGITCKITGPNCDKSYYLNIKKMGGLINFTKKPSRK
ncbi:hypothetical protein JXB11_02870 [Candidatus Woesearchaeota archaeon]|nr:hypothetical protein [Candidatus Woesearchaeota archaeon]